MANIEGRELIVIAESKPNDKGNFWKLRLVQWIVDGVSKSIKLEKRRFFTDEYGNVKTGKCDGFLLDDLKAVRPHREKIAEFMKNPPPADSPTAEQAAAMAKEVFHGEKQQDDEIPF